MSTVESLSDEQTMELIDKAEQAIDKLGLTFNDFDREELIYKTVLYLHSIRSLVSQQVQYPYYSVHCMEGDGRFETAAFSVAFQRYKKLCRDGKRVGMFEWLSDGEQRRLYASDDYPFSRDYKAFV